MVGIELGRSVHSKPITRFPTESDRRPQIQRTRSAVSAERIAMSQARRRAPEFVSTRLASSSPNKRAARKILPPRSRRGRGRAPQAKCTHEKKVLCVARRLPISLGDGTWLESRQAAPLGNRVAVRRASVRTRTAFGPCATRARHARRICPTRVAIVRRAGCAILRAGEPRSSRDAGSRRPEPSAPRPEPAQSWAGAQVPYFGLLGGFAGFSSVAGLPFSASIWRCLASTYLSCTLLGFWPRRRASV